MGIGGGGLSQAFAVAQQGATDYQNALTMQTQIQSNATTSASDRQKMVIDTQTKVNQNNQDTAANSAKVSQKLSDKWDQLATGG